MNMEPPSGIDWTVLLLVGALAGAVNAMRSYAAEGQKRAMLLGAIEGATALFVTVVSFLIMHTFIPIMFGVSPHVLGLIGLSGAIAHIGLRQAIKLAIRMADSATDKK